MLNDIIDSSANYSYFWNTIHKSFSFNGRGFYKRAEKEELPFTFRLRKFGEKMTRINAGIAPSSLCDQHLLAELRELPRIFGLAKRYYEKHGNVDELPKMFTLGTGHVRFFYDKLFYLANRQLDLLFEYKVRFKKEYAFDWGFIEEIPNALFNDWSVLHGFVEYLKARTQVELRIQSRLLAMKNIRYYSKEISSEDAIRILSI